MTKFNTVDRRSSAGQSPIRADRTQPTANHQGGTGYRRDAKSDLFLLATTSHDITATTFYEGGDVRVTRYVDLVHQVAVADPDWTYRFLVWLRTKGNIRTAAVVGAVEAARALLKAGIPGGRPLIAHVLTRADEPGEALAYHMSRYGRALPKPIKRGIADAAARLYTERAVLKYDTASHGVRFGDVLELTHAAPLPDRVGWQRDLFQHILDRRHNRADEIPLTLRTINANRTVRALMNDGPDWGIPTAAVIDSAGLTWEDVLSALGSKVDKATLWAALIPNLGIMAAIRNLRNIDQANVPDTAVQPILTRLADPDEIARSRQMPLRFLSAYRAAPSLRWAYPLERALDLSVNNIPYLTGRTLILIDTSGSMAGPLSERSELLRWDAAASFGLALARRCEAVDVVSFSAAHPYAPRPNTDSVAFPTNRGESLLKSITRFKDGGYFIGGGTDTAGALRRHYAGHDRVVILTDEQNGTHSTGLVGDQMPKDRPLFTANLAGYATSHAPADPYRITIGGLTDHLFALIPQIESGRNGGWSWETTPDASPAV